MHVNNPEHCSFWFWDRVFVAWSLLRKPQESIHLSVPLQCWGYKCVPSCLLFFWKQKWKECMGSGFWTQGLMLTRQELYWTSDRPALSSIPKRSVVSTFHRYQESRLILYFCCMPVALTCNPSTVFPERLLSIRSTEWANNGHGPIHTMVCILLCRERNSWYTVSRRSQLPHRDYVWTCQSMVWSPRTNKTCAPSRSQPRGDTVAGKLAQGNFLQWETLYLDLGRSHTCERCLSYIYLKFYAFYWIWVVVQLYPV